MQKLKNYVCGSWTEGEGIQSTLVNPSTNEELAHVSTQGIDFGAALNFARDKGGPALRAMTFAARGALLKAMAGAIHEHREELIAIGVKNAGNTRGDAKFDIDGSIGTLARYASIGKHLGDTTHWLDGDAQDMGQSSRMQGRHVFVPRKGVAVLINAYNFPAWGMLEKAACALLAGVPVLSKPATLTCMMAERIVEIIIDAEIMPEGSFSLISGSAGDLLDHLEFQDCLAFTGSATTGAMMRSHKNILAKGVRIGVEADSLNCAILGADVDSDSDTYDLFVRDVVTDITQKAGQKCTAIRRVLVPESMIEELKPRIVTELSRIKMGTPETEGVRMGPLSGPNQLKDARGKLEILMTSAERVIGDPDDFTALGDPEKQGAFMPPIVLQAPSADGAPEVHKIEVFGPVTTLIPYDGSAEDAARIVAMGEGGLVASFYSDDRKFAATLIQEMGPYQGRLVWGSKRSAGAAPSPGTVFPDFIHGGPGRAGDGEELGGMRGVSFYCQRLAVQGYGPLIDRLFDVKS
ncbi:MAG: 3,4-dehydroadipyl-CoA semialdehyde dehydrogenase [Planctomycetota bacterium]|jgi:3,4-dehydroadipyl-CoA semialdehyde dehydrogenase